MNKLVKGLQKKSGIKQGNFDNEKNRLYSMCQTSIFLLNDLWKQIEKAKMTNESFVLDWLDTINEISVRN